MLRLFEYRNVPVVVAHRGLHDRLPENSTAAFLAAWHNGIDWCECDVRISADGTPVIFHDDNLERIAGHPGRIDALAWSELQTIALRDEQGAPSDQTIPSLKQVLDVQPRQSGLLIELKTPMSDAQVADVVGVCRGRRVAYQSFDQQIMKTIARIEPDADTALLLHKFPQDAALYDGPWNALCVQHSAMVGQIATNPMPMGVWTLQQQSDYEQLRSHRLCILITDAPLQCVQWIK